MPGIVAAAQELAMFAVGKGADNATGRQVGRPRAGPYDWVQLRVRVASRSMPAVGPALIGAPAEQPVSEEQPGDQVEEGVGSDRRVDASRRQ